jgi:N-acyl-D-amino-acid deacylase
MSGERYGILIRGGTVIDGTGTPGVRADVAIHGDRIAAVGLLADAEASRVIDVAGLTVAPGFIDVHSHDDAACLTTPLDFKLMQGVTTDVLGNCGTGIAPYNPEQRANMIVGNVLGEVPEATWRTFGEFMRVVEQANPAINVACLVPHGAVRYATLGLSSRAPSDAELDQMREHIDEGMAAGAAGLSTGLIYPPGAFARTDEIIECAKIAARHGDIYVSHIRNEGDRLMEAVEEAATIGEQAGLPVQISHHKAGSPAVWGKVHDTIAFMQERRAAGQDITFDVYPYTAASTVLSAFAAAAEGLNFDLVLLATVPGHEEVEGKTLRESADILGVPAEQAASRILRDSPGTTAIFFLMHEDDIRTVISQPECMIGSDGLPTPGGKPHPRLYGTFPRVIQRYVREEAVLSLEEAVRKMTSLPADRFKLAGRGRIAEGAFADIVVFDPARIEDVATYAEPRQYPAGIDYVLVNGKVATEAGKQTEHSSGRLLRRGQE